MKSGQNILFLSKVKTEKFMFNLFIIGIIYILLLWDFMKEMNENFKFTNFSEFPFIVNKNE